MKYFLTILTICSLYTLSVYSQVKNTTHKVEQGETIAQIAQKYSVTPYDIYQLNPDVQRGLKPNSILLIPKKAGVQKSIAPAVTKANTHKVETKETLFSIEKKYGITDEALKKANPILEKEGLKIGQILLIPSITNVKNLVAKTEKAIFHEVLPKETKYSIAKLYGITVEELEKRNPEIIPNLTIGYQLLIKGSAPKKEEIKAIDSKKEIVIPIPVKTSKPIEYTTYEVKPKETLYSLSKMFGMSPEELTVLNPDLSNGLKEGMLLKVPSNPLIPRGIKGFEGTFNSIPSFNPFDKSGFKTVNSSGLIPNILDKL
jgi:LysM repeat protein